MDPTAESVILTNSMKLAVFSRWSDDLSFRVKGLFILLLPLSALLFMVWLISTMAAGRRVAEEWVHDSIEVRLCAQRAEILLLEMESQFGAYLVTGNVDLLAGHSRSETSLLAVVSELAARVASHGQESRHLVEARDVINREHIALSSFREGLPSQPGTKTLAPQGSERFQQKLSSMRDVRREIEAIDPEEDRFLSRRLSQQEQVYSKFFLTAIVIACVCPILGFVLNLRVGGRVTRRLGRLRNFVHLLVHELPMIPVPGGKDEIGQLAKELGITARALNERERELKRREQELTDVFDRAPVAFQELDVHGVILRANEVECELLGYERAEILGKHVWDLVSPEQRSACLQMVIAVVEGETAGGSLVQDFLRKDGSKIRLSTRLKAISAERGRVKGVSSVLVSASGPQESGERPAGCAQRTTEPFCSLAD